MKVRRVRRKLERNEWKFGRDNRIGDGWEQIEWKREERKMWETK